MKSTKAIVIAAFVAFFCSRADAQTPLVLEAKIALGDVRGRIDHMTFDVARNRLFVAELENNSISVVDTGARKVLRRITDLKGPQGLGYVAPANTLFVANGGDGSLRMFRGAELQSIGQIELGEDADNVRLDPIRNQVIVAYGSGALAIIDVARRNKATEIPLGTHAEGFQIDRGGKRIYANDPTGKAILVVDRRSGKKIATWKAENGANFPMALNESLKQVIVGFRNPAKLVGFDVETGTAVSSTDICGDTDDLFVDAKRQRIYVSCGEGFVDVFEIKRNLPYQRIAHVETSIGARTSLLVPSTDRLYVAARATQNSGATIWVFRLQP